MTHAFKHLRPPAETAERIDRPTFGRRPAIPSAAPRRRRVSTASRVFCAGMIVWGLAMIALGAV